MQALSIDGAHSDRVLRIGVAVKVALIVDSAAIAGSKDKDGAFALPAVGDAVEHGFGDESTRRFARATIIGWTPRARVDVVLVIAIVESGCLVHVADASAEDSDASDFGAVSDAHAADVVLDGSYLAGTSGAVLIVR